MDGQTVLVLGANGRLGRVLVQAFARAGWNVVAQARRPLADAAPACVRPLVVPVTDTAAIAAGARGAGVVVNAMNALYTRWDTEALPLNDAAIEVARALGATLMLPGNIYNFGSPLPALLAEDTPQRPANRKGEIRCAMEQAMVARAPRSIVVRAGDFFGGPGTGSWMDEAIVKDLARGRIVYPGPRGLPHAWAFLPDLAQVFVELAQVREQLAAHETFHFPGYTLTGDELVAAIEGAARRTGVLRADQAPVVKTLPWALLRVVGLFVPMLRELARMNYLWRQPHRLAGEKLARTIGHVTLTPPGVAFEATLVALKLQGGAPAPAL